MSSRAMLRHLLGFALLATMASATPAWRSTWDAAMRQAQEQEQPLLIFFTASDCPWSARLESTLDDPEVQPLLAPYSLLRINTATHAAVALRERIRSTPTLLVIHPETLSRQKLEGYHEASDTGHFLETSLKPPPAPAPDPGTDMLSLRLRTLGSIRNRTEHIRVLLAEDPFPAAALVAALEDPTLAVRLGALEVLEAHTGRNHGFDPWQPAESQEEALRAWQQWSGSESHTAGSAHRSAFTTSLIDGYIAELFSQDPTRSRRALDMLSEGGIPVARHLEQTATSRGQLSPREYNLLRQASLAARLRAWGVERSTTLARELITGNPDARMAALETLGQLGPKAQPLLAQFLNDDDILVREAAVETLVAHADAQALPIITARWQVETNPDVRVGILRAVSEINDQATVDLLNLALQDDTEDIRILALEYLGHLSKLNYDLDLIRACLSDRSWRVRAAALETAQRLRLTDLAPDITPLLQDEDDFVSNTALDALARLSGAQSQPELITLFANEPNLRLAILNIYISNDWLLPPAFIEGIQGLPSERDVELAGTLRNLRTTQLPLATAYLDHPNEDLRIAAIISIAANGSRNPELRTRLTNILHNGSRAERMAVLQHFEYDEDKVPSLARTSADESHTANTRPATPSLFSRIFSRNTGQASQKAENKDKETEEPQAELPPLAPLKEAALPLARQSDDPELSDSAAFFITLLGSPDALDILKANIPGMTQGQQNMLFSKLNSFQEPWVNEVARESIPHLQQSSWEAISALFSQGSFSDNFRFLIEHASQRNDEVVFSYLDRVPFSRLWEESDINEARTALREVYDDPELSNFHPYALAAWRNSRIIRWPEDRDWLMEQTRSDDPLIRRAAWSSILLNQQEELENVAPSLARDPDPRVREVLPASAQLHDKWFEDHYSETSRSRSSHISSHRFGSRSKPSLPKTLEALDSLITKDPVRTIRLRAMIAKAELQDNLGDVPLFVETFRELPEREDNYHRIKWWISNHVYAKYPDFGIEYEALLPWVSSSGNNRDYSKRYTIATIRGHFSKLRGDDGSPTASDDGEPSPQSTHGLTLLANDPTDVPDDLQDDTVHAGMGDSPGGASATAPPATLPLRVIFFTQTGCADCARVRDYLHQLQPIFPELDIETHNVRNMDAIRHNEHLSEHFGVPVRDRLVAPAIFAANGALIRDAITLDSLSHLLAGSLGSDPAILAPPAEAETTATAERISERFHGMTLAVVLTAGLLDGLNPCAFATIIFFLSYLQIARRTPIQILQVGLAFVLGIFLTYFALGLGLLHLITRLTALQHVALAINWLLAIMVLIIGILSFRDGILCLRGRLQDTTLQLPRPLKRAANALIRTGVRHSRFVIAAFVIGMGISVLELACTGQVYLPTITFVLQSGTERLGALGYLLLYNIAFILPLLIVIALAWKGLTSARLTTFFQKHVALVKFANATLFATLFAFFLMILIP